MSSSVPIPGSLPPDVRQRLGDYPFKPEIKYIPMKGSLFDRRTPEDLRENMQRRLKSLASINGRDHRWLRDNPEHAAWLKANVEERLWENLKASEKEWEYRVANGSPIYAIKADGTMVSLD